MAIPVGPLHLSLTFLLLLLLLFERGLGHQLGVSRQPDSTGTVVWGAGVAQRRAIASLGRNVVSRDAERRRLGVVEVRTKGPAAQTTPHLTSSPTPPSSSSSPSAVTAVGGADELRVMVRSGNPPAYIEEVVKVVPIASVARSQAIRLEDPHRVSDFAAVGSSRRGAWLPKSSAQGFLINAGSRSTFHTAAPAHTQEGGEAGEVKPSQSLNDHLGNFWGHFFSGTGKSRPKALRMGPPDAGKVTTEAPTTTTDEVVVVNLADPSATISKSLKEEVDHLDDTIRKEEMKEAAKFVYLDRLHGWLQDVRRSMT